VEIDRLGGRSIDTAIETAIETGIDATIDPGICLRPQVFGCA
jgi:predicted metallo-beta-lactamase superfamily hydrolase